MDVKDAYKTIKELPDRNFLVECSDFGGFFGFVFAPEEIKAGDMYGGMYDCVEKETGRVFTFSPFDDFDLFDSGVQLPLETFADL